MADDRYVLDTHVWIWYLEGDLKLNKKARYLIENENSALLLSTLSVWEVLVAAERKRITLLPDPERCITKYLKILPLQEVAVTTEIARLSRSLEFDHADPADRFIAATAYANNCQLLTADRKLLAIEWLKSVDAG